MSSVDGSDDSRRTIHGEEGRFVCGGLREGRVGLLVVLCGVCVLCVCVISRGAAWSVWVCGCVSMGGERVVVLVMIRSVDD